MLRKTTTTMKRNVSSGSDSSTSNSNNSSINNNSSSDYNDNSDDDDNNNVSISESEVESNNSVAVSNNSLSSSSSDTESEDESVLEHDSTKEIQKQQQKEQNYSNRNYHHTNTNNDNNNFYDSGNYSDPLQIPVRRRYYHHPSTTTTVTTTGTTTSSSTGNLNHMIDVENPSNSKYNNNNNNYVTALTTGSERQQPDDIVFHREYDVCHSTDSTMNNIERKLLLLQSSSSNNNNNNTQSNNFQKVQKNSSKRYSRKRRSTHHWTSVVHECISLMKETTTDVMFCCCRKQRQHTLRGMGNKNYCSNKLIDNSDRLSLMSSSNSSSKLKHNKQQQSRQKSNKRWNIISSCTLYSTICFWISVFVCNTITLSGSNNNNDSGWSLSLLLRIRKEPNVIYVSDPFHTVQQQQQQQQQEKLNSIDTERSLFGTIWDLLSNRNGRDSSTSSSTHNTDNNKRDKIYNRRRGHRRDNKNNNLTFVCNKKSTPTKNSEDALPFCREGNNWHTTIYPTCNGMHEYTLTDLYYSLPSSSNNAQFIGAGYWRDVWALDNIPMHPINYNNNTDIDIDIDNLPITIALKMMKIEHDVDYRNFERHKRDAIVMEQLTSSNYVVNMYGYCGNSVLSEHLSMTVQHITSPIISTSTNNNDKYRSHFNIGEQNTIDTETVISDTIDESNTTTSIDNDNDSDNEQHNVDVLAYKERQLLSGATRETPEGRLQLAYYVAKSIQALHTIVGGPIVHADIQSKQFLLGSVPKRRTNTNTKSKSSSPVIVLKINDFNRCRFMLTHNTTYTPCPFRIPTAPGRHRSPEEYLYQNLTEKLDMYAIGNVMYEILTGLRAWNENGTTETRNMVIEGIIPNVPEQFQTPANAVDYGLFVLTKRCYDVNPIERISSTELVSELEQLANNFNVTL